MPLPALLGAVLTYGGAALAGKEVLDLFDEPEASKQGKSQKKLRQIERLLADTESYNMSVLEGQVRREGDLITQLERLGSRANDAAMAVAESESLKFQEMLVREQQTMANTATRLPPSIPEVAAMLGIRM